MINPLRSEEEAFRATVLTAIIAAPVIAAALLFGGRVALGVVAGLAYAGVFAWALQRRRAQPSSDGDSSPPSGQGPSG